MDYVNQEAILVYIIGMPFMMYLKGLGEIKSPLSITYCMADVICNIEHCTKAYMCIMVMLLMIHVLKRYFRVGVILRYHNPVKMYLDMVKKVSILAAVVSFYQTVVAVLIGAGLAQYSCNWSSMAGAPYHIMGNVVNDPVNSLQIILIYTYTVYVTVLVSGLLLCTGWCITMTPITGFLCVVILLVLETGTNIYARVFYSILDMAPSKMYLYGTFHAINIILPLVYLVLLSGIGIAVLSKREYMRVK